MTPIIITTERINSFGYRILSSGGDVSDFLKNPVLLYDHTRRERGENNKDIILPIGKLNDLKQENGSWTGVPEFDQDDDFANKIASKYNKGYLNAASVGIEIIEISEDPELMEKGQTLPTVTKWKLKEVSITDIPGNADAVKLSYQGNFLTLNGRQDADEVQKFFKPKQTTSMKKSIVALNATGLVELPDTATDELVESGIKAIAGKLSAKEEEIATLKKDNDRLKAEAAEAKTAGLKERATTMVEAALSGKKIVAEQKDSYITLASASEESFKATKAILDKAKPYEAVHSRIEDATLSSKTSKELVTMYDAMHKDGSLAQLKADKPEEFKLLHAAKFPTKNK